jgi:uncharacterized coiled-coil protein SlyX
MSAVHTVIVVKARLRNFGNGILEFSDDAVKFYSETGRFRKRREIVREIPMAEVEGVERQGNDLSISWKGTTDVLFIEQTSQIDTIYERITANLTEAEKRLTADQARNQLAQMTVNAMETADSLFDILKNLHGRVDWKLVESSYKVSEENVARLANQSATSPGLDIKPLSVAVQEHRPKEIAEKAYDVLRALYEHFDRLASSVKDEEKSHPNPHDAKLLIHTNYILNDIALGAVVGDEGVGKESAELLKALDDLAKLPNPKIDVNGVKTSWDKVSAEKDKQTEVIENVKLMLERELKELITPTTSHQPKK